MLCFECKNNICFGNLNFMIIVVDMDDAMPQIPQ